MRSGTIVAPRDELLAKFWPDVNITENTLTRNRGHQEGTG